jgi:hypothetical protein
VESPKRLEFAPNEYVGACSFRKTAHTFAEHALGYDDFGRTQSKIMNVIDPNSLERDAGEKPASTFSHPALSQKFESTRQCIQAFAV